MKRPGRLAGGLLLALAAPLLAACHAFRQVAAKYPGPDVAALYREAAHNPERNPVILIPGFAGTRLERLADGKAVWGEFFTPEALSYATPEGFRAFSLDLRQLPESYAPSRLAALEDDAVAVAPLGRVRTEAVVADVSFTVYGTLLELLGDAGYIRDSGANVLDYDRPLCFPFVYDWRQDVVGNAVALGRFLDETRDKVRAGRRAAGLPERPVRFDVVAHSMGGLVARYYLRYGARDVLDDPPAEVPWAGAADIDRLVIVSTPNFGSMKVLRDLVRGRTHPVLPTLPASALASMVSIYQMLPREAHPLWLGADGEGHPFAYMDVSTWVENGWGPFAAEGAEHLAWLYPAVRSPEERRQRMATFMAAAFERARRLAAALDRHPATRPPTTLVLFAGDADPTPARARLVRRDGRLAIDFEGPALLGLAAPGDGTITRASALADERAPGDPPGWLRSPIPWDWTLFLSDRHATFLRNPTFEDNLLHLLFEQPPRSRER